MKKIDSKKLVWTAWVLIFILVIYFLLPYILQILGVKSAVVMSGSMTHHKEDRAFFESYWQSRGISAGKIPFSHGINIGDLVIFSAQSNYKIGDVVVFTTTASSMITTTHRLYYYNNTNFRDIWDWCITENKSKQVFLMPSGIRIVEVTDPQSVADADLIYEGPAFEECSYNWLPVSNIKGKVLFVLPAAGLFYEKLHSYKTQEE